MSIYRIKIWLADNESVYRKIDIRGSQNFEQLHQAILNAVNFDEGQLASFYISDEDWEQGTEITLLEMGDTDEENELLVMRSTELDHIVGENFNRFIYVYDFVNMWTFRLQVLETLPEQEGLNYPMVVESEGAVPEQYPVETDLTHVSEDEASLMNALSRKNRKQFLFDEEEELENDFDDPDNPGFDELDEDTYYDDLDKY
ncbi:MAG: hypothetical protein WD077_07280 [Bacteroidia bacterium]